MKNSSPSEEQLIAGCLSQDRQTANRFFDDLVRRHQKRIYALGFRFFHNHDDAEEITQKTFIRVHKKIHSFREKAQLGTWIFQIALNLCKNQIRDEGRKKLLYRKWQVLLNTFHLENLAYQGKEVDPCSKIQEKSSKQEVLQKAIRSLPPMQQTIVILRIYEELSFSEIASLANCSISSAKTNYHYAIKRLKELCEGKTT